MASDTPSDTVLDETPGRALKFLGAVSNNTTIFAILTTRGYSEAIHDHGWQLLLAASGYKRPRPRIVATPAGRAAVDELDLWDEPNFKVAHAALDGAFPAQSEYIFTDLTPQTGVGAIVSVTTFLDRRDVLKKGRDGSEKQDQAAVAKLAERGITDAVCAHLRDLLKQAVATPGAAPPEDTPPPSADPAAARTAKIALHEWYAEWAAIAHADVKRRDYLIQLGLATRKVKAKKKDPNAGSGSGAQGGATAK